MAGPEVALSTDVTFGTGDDFEGRELGGIGFGFSDGLIGGLAVNNYDFKIAERLAGKVLEKMGKILFLV